MSNGCDEWTDPRKVQEETRFLISSIVEAIKRIGKAEQKILEIIKDHRQLSKHDPFYQSEYELESDRLHSCRCKINMLYEEITEVLHILRVEDND